LGTAFKYVFCKKERKKERKKEESSLNTCRIQGEIMTEQTENNNLEDMAFKMKRLFGQHRE
jgi:hypothetical protein